MKRKIMIELTALICTWLCIWRSNAQQMPQDNWYFERTWGTSGTNAGQFLSPCGIAIDGDGLVYVADSGNHRIQVFQADGAFVRKWGSSGSAPGQLSYPRGIAIGVAGLVYVADYYNDRIQVFQADGTFVRAWGSDGSAPGQFNYPSGIAIGGDGFVYTADIGNDRIQVFQADGTFVRKWGSYGSALGQFRDPRAIAIGVAGLVYVADYDRIQVFQADGTFVRKWGQFFWQSGIAVGGDGFVYVADTYNYRIQVFQADGTFVKKWGSSGSALGQFSLPRGIAVGGDGLAYVADTDNDRIQVFRRSYRWPRLSGGGAVPTPAVLNVAQRAGLPYLDIDYCVWDQDSTNLSVAALAFVNGSNTLGNVLRLNTLVEGTSSNLGPNIAANVTNRLTWNAAADWATDYGNVAIEILANDGAGLLDFGYITIPSNGPDPALTIDKSPLTQQDLLSLWYWLVATNDPAINLVSGKVYGVSGAYSGKTLAQTTNTTADGRAFLFERLNVRPATSAEVSRAMQASTPGVTNKWTPRIYGDRRLNVNQYGFDTGAWGTNAWFVVPLP